MAGPVFDTVFERILTQTLEREISDETGHLAGGLAKDYADYKERVGKIAGLNTALTFIETVRKELVGGKDK